MKSKHEKRHAIHARVREVGSRLKREAHCLRAEFKAPSQCCECETERCIFIQFLRVIIVLFKVIVALFVAFFIIVAFPLFVPEIQEALLLKIPDMSLYFPIFRLFTIVLVVLAALFVVFSIFWFLRVMVREFR